MTNTFARVAPTLVATLVMSTDIEGQVSVNAAEGTASTEFAVTLTERQVFELDLNGRMALVESSVHDTIDK